MKYFKGGSFTKKGKLRYRLSTVSAQNYECKIPLKYIKPVTSRVNPPCIRKVEKYYYSRGEGPLLRT